MVISLLAIFALPNLSALTLTLDSPSKVNLNEEFLVSINADSSENHDVKIFVHNSNDKKVTRKEYISEILDENWKSSWYYLKESFPNNKQYRIRVFSSPGEREICLRLRKSNSTISYTKCNPIEVGESEAGESEESAKNEENYEYNEEEIQEKVEKQEKSTVYKVKQVTLNSETQSKNLTSENNEKIVLNSPASTYQTEFITKQEKTRIYTTYAFTFFTVLIIIFLSLKKL